MLCHLFEMRERWRHFHPPSTAWRVPNWDMDVNGENARVLALSEGRSLAHVRRDFQASLEAVMLLLDDLTEKDFSSPGRFDWLHGDPAWVTLADSSFQHYTEPPPDLRLDANS